MRSSPKSASSDTPEQYICCSGLYAKKWEPVFVFQSFRKGGRATMANDDDYDMDDAAADTGVDNDEVQIAWETAEDDYDQEHS